MERSKKISKVLMGIIITVLLGMLCNVNAGTITIYPNSEEGEHYNYNSEMSMEYIEGLFGYDPGTLSLLYKAEVGDSNAPATTYEGLYASSYIAEFFNAPLDPKDATISYVDSSDIITGDPLHLVVKDGDYGTYIFDLTNLHTNIELVDAGIPPYSWNGTDTIKLANFWPDNGAISHVSIVGAASVPEPATLFLLGTGLIGLAGIGRKNLFKK